MFTIKRHYQVGRLRELSFTHFCYELQLAPAVLSFTPPQRRGDDTVATLWHARLSIRQVSQRQKSRFFRHNWHRGLCGEGDEDHTVGARGGKQEPGPWPCSREGAGGG